MSGYQLRHPDGKPLTFTQRQLHYRENLPVPTNSARVVEPSKLTYEQRRMQWKAEEEGKRLAAERAEKRERGRLAALPPQPRNIHRELLAQNIDRYQDYYPGGTRRRMELESLAEARDREIAAELAAAEKAERVANDPCVRAAIE